MSNSLKDLILILYLIFLFSIYSHYNTWSLCTYFFRRKQLKFKSKNELFDTYNGWQYDRL